MSVLKKGLAVLLSSVVFLGSVMTVTFAGSAGGGVQFQTNSQDGFGGSQSLDYNPSVPGSGTYTGDSLLTTIRNAINRILGMLGIIALIVLLRGGFQMVTAAGDDGKYQTGFTILKQAGIGLAFIGISWLFVSVVFFLLETVIG